MNACGMARKMTLWHSGYQLIISVANTELVGAMVWLNVKQNLMLLTLILEKLCGPIKENICGLGLK